MKKYCYILLSALLCLQSALLLSSCAGGTGGSLSDGEATALSVRLPEGRALYNASDIVSYVVKISNSSYKEQKDGTPGTSIIFEEIPVGTYDIIVIGYASDGAIAAKGTTKTTVVANETSTASLTVYRQEQVAATNFNGSIAEFLSATFPANTAATAYTVTITGSATTAELEQLAKAIGSTDTDYNKGVYINLDLSRCSATALPRFFFTNSLADTQKAGEYLTGITLPSGITEIPHSAFYGGGFLHLTSITIPASVQKIYASAFQYCVGITLTYADSLHTTWTLYSSEGVGTSTDRTNPQVSDYDSEAPLGTGSYYWYKTS